MCATGVQVSPQQDFKLERRFPMKKMLSFVAIALLVMGLATSVFAVPPYASTDCYDTKYTIVNNSTTTKVSIIPSSLIGANGTYELLKVDVSRSANPAGTAGESLVAIYDSIVPLTSIGAFCECELESNDDDTISKTWVRPLRIYNGVTIMQGAYSVVSIEYQRAGR